jgi:hypothetical protein
MHHKKKKPKNQRAGCLMCKPHKINGVDKRSKSNAKPSDFRQYEKLAYVEIEKEK